MSPFCFQFEHCSLAFLLKLLLLLIFFSSISSLHLPLLDLVNVQTYSYWSRYFHEHITDSILAVAAGTLLQASIPAFMCWVFFFIVFFLLLRKWPCSIYIYILLTNWRSQGRILWLPTYLLPLEISDDAAGHSLVLRILNYDLTPPSPERPLHVSCFHIASFSCL